MAPPPWRSARGTWRDGPRGRGTTTPFAPLSWRSRRELGYATREAPDGLAGLRILQSDARIDLLVTDVGLPGLNGRQLADQARTTRPDLKVLFMTGYARERVLWERAPRPRMQ